MSIRSELRKLLVAMEVEPTSKTIPGLLGEVSVALGGQNTGKTIAEQIHNIAVAKGFPEDGDWTVTYNVNGGTGSIDSVDVKAGESIELNDGSSITAPENKEFAGWAKSSSAQNPTVESPYTPTEDVTLYAVWKYIVYTVTYSVNGGTGSIDPEEVNAGSSVSLNDGSSITAPEGKEFVGWADSADAASANIISPYTPVSDITIYAVWADTAPVEEPAGE